MVNLQSAEYIARTGITGSGPVFGMAGWVRSRVGGGRVAVAPFLGWPGGSGPVLGVAGWEWSSVGGDRVGVVQYSGWPGGSGPVFG